MLKSRSRKFWKGRKILEGRSRSLSRTFYLRLRNPGLYPIWEFSMWDGNGKEKNKNMLGLMYWSGISVYIIFHEFFKVALITKLSIYGLQLYSHQVSPMILTVFCLYFSWQFIRACTVTSLHFLINMQLLFEQLKATLLARIQNSGFLSHYWPICVAVQYCVQQGA